MRVTKGPAARHKKNRIFRQAKGFQGKRKNCWKTARQVVRRSKQQAYIGRKQRKRINRSLWITRISAAARQRGLTYSRLRCGLGKAKVELDRKILADIAVHDPKSFDAIVETAKRHI